MGHLAHLIPVIRPVGRKILPVSFFCLIEMPQYFLGHFIFSREFRSGLGIFPQIIIVRQQFSIIVFPNRVAFNNKFQ